MTFDEYQKLAITTDTFGGKPQAIDSHAFLSKLLGLVGETGEFAEKFKKVFRDDGGKLSVEKKAEIVKELGDVLWYINALCCYLEVELDDVANINLDKVLGRKARGVTKGSGDNR
jgi:NTP pyrophosphatase (non-canonical NTP hydrolase)